MLGVGLWGEIGSLFCFNKKCMSQCLWDGLRFSDTEYWPTIKKFIFILSGKKKYTKMFSKCFAQKQKTLST